MSFWDIMMFIIISYAFIAYLILLFSILRDLFRDREMSGGMKAVWLLLFIFVPIITTVVYLIVRGDGMAERSMRRMQPAERARYLQELADEASAEAQAPDARQDALKFRGRV